MSAFAKDILNGFSQANKTIPAKYFYNDEGSRLFAEIMQLPEYYLTQSEVDVFLRHSNEIITTIAKQAEGIQLIELGAGNGVKTKLLLDAVVKEGVTAAYTPIDISAEAIQSLMGNLESKFPEIPFKPIVADYFNALESLKASTDMRKVVMFLGSTIGNFTWKESVDLLRHIVAPLQKGDLLLIGFDLKKNPKVIREAYDDSSGVTKAFNMNLLTRINVELQANFDLASFDHYASYSPETGEARSYLVSLEEQEVWIEALSKSFHFEKWEYIHTEISRKYDQSSMAKLAQEINCRPVARFEDERQYFANAVWEVL